MLNLMTYSSMRFASQTSTSAGRQDLLWLHPYFSPPFSNGEGSPDMKAVGEKLYTHCTKQCL